MSDENKDIKIKKRIIDAGYKAINELIAISEESVLKKFNDGPSDIIGGEDLAADKLKNAAATKKLAIFDAFEILERIKAEQLSIDSELNGGEPVSSNKGFAERNAGRK